MKPIEKVVEWVNKDKPLWWRHAIRLALQHGELNNDHLNYLFIMAQMEFRLLEQDPQYKINVTPVLATGFGHENVPVNLLGLSNVKNVSALVDNKELTFSETVMTAVYGDNGAGKSSYAKILKLACLTRGNVPDIMTNIFSPSTTTSEATLTIKVGNSTSKTLRWQKEASPNAELKSIRVFDSHSAIHYVTKEDNINYKPAEIRLVDELTKACQAIKDITNKELNNNNTSFILSNLNVGTKANAFLQSLTLITTTDEIDAHCGKPEELQIQKE
ncbi:MAG: energy-coupling factor transporter ATP-binding protein EcfA2 [Alteromonadaceae bacterium]|jgi:energy-coupling factor transporter ATP-binding protein EcfA2